MVVLRGLAFLYTSLVLLACILVSGDIGCGSHCSDSCCETASGNFQCCPFTNGVCCVGGKFCCPQGSTCDGMGLTCTFSNGIIVSTKRLSKQDGNLTQEGPEKPTESTPTICPDTTSACPFNSTCCSMTGGLWGCCQGSNAVCCSDGLHCCPHGTKCNVKEGGCEPVNEAPVDPEQLFSQLFSAELGRARSKSDRVEQRPSADSASDRLVWYSMSYSGVQCSDGTHECPSGTTCCLDSFGSYACCPFPKAVCCSDRLHCCPENYQCDEPTGRCLSNVALHSLQALLKPKPSGEANLKDEQLCPDGYSRCPASQTCCALPDKSWGCCPLPEATCCPDGLHCCPSGYKCNAERKACVRQSSTASPPPPPPPSVAKITCPNADFQCDNGTTCCPLPNDEWACCPFEKAVCCSDQAHCCPQNTRCDVAHNQCIVQPSLSLPAHEQPPQVVRLKLFRLTTKPNTTEACQMACPTGTCCRDTAGLDACCPLATARCCSDGLHCCPHGKQCDASSGMCLALATANRQPPVDSLPWMAKLPAFRRIPTHEKPEYIESAAPPRNVTCPDRRYVCRANQTCCILIDGQYGCCPFANATCCWDRQHCCPANMTCGPFGQCYRRPDLQLEQTVSPAYRMQPTVGKSSWSSTPVNLDRVLGKPVQAEWCGDLCPSGGFCCADASGLPRRKCCPATAGVCCADGEHCCPRGTRCIANGQCQSEDRNVQASAAPYLVPAMDQDGTSAGFIKGLKPQSSYANPLAMNIKPAKVNPMFLLNTYYNKYSGNFTVCPDLERVCSLDQQCCLSLKHRFTCAPRGATCCPYAADTCCPPDTRCSQDGLLCVPV